jgi:hypothetical protein
MPEQFSWAAIKTPTSRAQKENQRTISCFEQPGLVERIPHKHAVRLSAFLLALHRQIV